MGGGSLYSVCVGEGSDIYPSKMMRTCIFFSQVLAFILSWLAAFPPLFYARTVPHPPPCLWVAFFFQAEEIVTCIITSSCVFFFFWSWCSLIIPQANKPERGAIFQDFLKQRERKHIHFSGPVYHPPKYHSDRSIDILSQALSKWGERSGLQLPLNYSVTCACDSDTKAKPRFIQVIVHVSDWVMLEHIF